MCPRSLLTRWRSTLKVKKISTALDAHTVTLDLAAQHVPTVSFDLAAQQVPTVPLDLAALDAPTVDSAALDAL